jgi:small subunit ribosomal protein S17
MAENETPETPETVVDEVENAARGEGEAAAGDEPSVSGDERSEADEAVGETAPEAAAEETPGAEGAEAAEAEAGAEAAEAAAPAKPAAKTRREKLEERRAARRPAPRGAVTPEQRDEERQARRAVTARQRRAYRAKLKERRAATSAERSGPEPSHAPEHGPGRPKVRQGVVTSAKGDKTITVQIDVVRRHRRYHKILRSTAKLYAHDEANNANEGDTVRVVECRPMSATKRWRLTEVLERAK